MRVITYNKDNIKEEVNKCLSCKNPLCEKGCPIKNHIRDFIKALKDDNLELARQIVYENSKLPFICSVVCPHERFCQGNCVKAIKGVGVNVGAIESYIVNTKKMELKIKEKINKKVFIVGSGPAGLISSIYLAEAGFDVTIYEKEDKLGGILYYGIPEYRIDKEKLDRINEMITGLGINIVYNKELNENDILNLKNDYDFGIICCGLNSIKTLDLINDSKVLSPTYILKEYNDITKYKKPNTLFLKGNVMVVGAGNVAMDVSRTFVRLGLKTDVVYRRTINEATCSKEEIELAIHDNVNFHFLENPIKIEKENDRLKVTLSIMELYEKEGETRKQVKDSGKTVVRYYNYVCFSIGYEMDKKLSFNKIKVENNLVKVDENYQTNILNLYACGDIAHGAKTVVEAVLSAKIAVRDILSKIN